VPQPCVKVWYPTRQTPPTGVWIHLCGGFTENKFKLCGVGGLCGTKPFQCRRTYVEKERTTGNKFCAICLPRLLQSFTCFFLLLVFVFLFFLAHLGFPLCILSSLLSCIALKIEKDRKFASCYSPTPYSRPC
jgi:hypothetical protein